ncbi:Cation channel sperm-associated protein subunit beta [Tupaia chinensis]|uniref:Cation channel sperm-associated protein subunit beta n=1 Tax=Tupaia chinensis TaxID=246437 RepID=L9JZI9_TUPCH|nr:Cation channel sperm-associated protein subunit beta [Tupaia chinensis]
MPRIVPINMTFTEGSWFLYNFGQRNGRTWTIHAKPCNYLLQHSDEHPALNMVKYIDLGNSQDLKIKVIPNSEGMHLSEVPLLNVAVGNPTLLEVKAEGYFDDADSYVMEINIASKVLLQGSSSLSFVIWGASVECFVTTVVPTLKSSCDYLRSMHHTPNTIISREDWARGVHRDNQGFNMIKALPVPRYKFPVTQYPISLEIKTEDGYISVKSPYLVTVTEVNMRKNWKLNLSRRQIRFQFDGQLVNGTDTPAQLEMEDEDTPDVFQQQTGSVH